MKKFKYYLILEESYFHFISHVIFIYLFEIHLIMNTYNNITIFIYIHKLLLLASIFFINKY